LNSVFHQTCILECKGSAFFFLNLVKAFGAGVWLSLRALALYAQGSDFSSISGTKNKTKQKTKTLSSDVFLFQIPNFISSVLFPIASCFHLLSNQYCSEQPTHKDCLFAA
jgi:hypothetical protein